jgi:hypothetical protein
VNVASGGKLWDFSSEQSGVLYLALEDNRPRLQDRLNKIEAVSIDISRLTSPSRPCCSFTHKETARRRPAQHLVGQHGFSRFSVLFAPREAALLASGLLAGTWWTAFSFLKKIRGQATTALTIANRNTEGFCFKLRFDPDNCNGLSSETMTHRREKKRSRLIKTNGCFFWLMGFIKTHGAARLRNCATH